MTATIGVDIGATKMLACRLEADGTVAAELRVPTPPSADGIVDALVDAVRMIAADPIPPVGLSVAGWVDRDRKIIAFSPHLDWRDEPLARILGERLRTPVLLENDANAAAWAEFRFGAGRASTDLLLVTVGSGIGSGIVSGGQLLRGANGMAGELGHTALVRDGPPCPCGRRGCVDMFGSGRALERAFARIAGVDTPGTDVGERALAGEPDALSALDTIAHAIGAGAAEAVMLLDPDAVVLGGGASTLGEALRAPVEAYLRAALGVHFDPARLSVAIAETGPLAGALGAADLARTAGP